MMGYIMLPIEKNIPFPEKKAGGRSGGWGRSNMRFPLHDMVVGDSFLVPGISNCSSFWRSVSNFMVKHPGRKFTTRVVSNGVRCWRIS